MKIKIEKSENAPSLAQIDYAERELGGNIDSSYRDFILNSNGGIPETNTFRISDRNASGINQFIPFDRVFYERALISDQVGLNVLPIAYVEGGNYLCLLVNGRDRGVYFFDHEIPGLDALTKLASSFSEFMDTVKPFDPKQITLRPGQVKEAWINPEFLKK